jgi:hypothetical protein
MADVNGVLQVEMRRQCRQVIGIVIHVVTLAHLRGAAVAAAVMRDHAIALLEEEHHLPVPVIARQRPAMAEHDGLTFAPVLVENLDAVFGRNRTHAVLLHGWERWCVRVVKRVLRAPKLPTRHVHNRVGPKSTLVPRNPHVCFTTALTRNAETPNFAKAKL